MKNLEQTKLKNPFLHYGLLLFIYGLGALTLLTHTVFHNHSYAAAKNSVEAEHCNVKGETHIIIMTAKTFEPAKVSVKRCDTVVFVNRSKNLYKPALGKHEEHILYTGFSEKVLGPGEKNSFVAHTKGTLEFHEHLQDALEGELIIE